VVTKLVTGGDKPGFRVGAARFRFGFLPTKSSGRDRFRSDGPVQGVLTPFIHNFAIVDLF
jgi:hypothetical protein